MSRDGLREENLHNKEEKRITSRDEDIEVSRNPKKEEDFGKNRRERITENKDIPTRKKSSDITRYSIDKEQKVQMEQDLGNEDAKEDISLMEDSGTDKHAVFRTESIRGQPRSERAALETAVDSRKLRQRKMVRDYAEREKRKEKEASRQQKTAEKENVRYRETSQVTEESLEGFQDEIKGKAKRERILKEQKKQSRLSFGDEGEGMVHGAGTGIRKSTSAVKNAALTVGHWKAHEAEDKKRKEAITAKNNAEALIYQAEKTVKELGDKADQGKVKEVNDAIAKLKETLKGNDTEKIKADALALAAALEGVSLTIGAKTSSTGTIFGSVNNIQIAEALEKLGHIVDRKQIVIKDTVKEVGNYKAIVKLHKEVSVEIPFEVVAE